VGAHENYVLFQTRSSFTDASLEIKSFVVIGQHRRAQPFFTAYINSFGCIDTEKPMPSRQAPRLKAALLDVLAAEDQMDATEVFILSELAAMLDESSGDSSAAETAELLLGCSNLEQALIQSIIDTATTRWEQKSTSRTLPKKRELEVIASSVQDVDESHTPTIGIRLTEHRYQQIYNYQRDHDDRRSFWTEEYGGVPLTDTWRDEIDEALAAPPHDFIGYLTDIPMLAAGPETGTTQA
jgi:hypothetical protein